MQRLERFIRRGGRDRPFPIRADRKARSGIRTNGIAKGVLQERSRFRLGEVYSGAYHIIGRGLRRTCPRACWLNEIDKIDPAERGRGVGARPVGYLEADTAIDPAKVENQFYDNVSPPGEARAVDAEDHRSGLPLDRALLAELLD